ncbi:sugar kinase [Flavimaricola marinus]|uniref:2-dehydro-3-deoxygluconokinase n=1 Tax=Flavimaricola marinus TaxID=1819565 RepID=A0A238LGT2_9RHOB|nr:sugar kinase [Flavimaricola marinus]SMY08615.1 2-dehydro-3-deoxygluconokinase [Flavimaricola marinus]
MQAEGTRSWDVLCLGEPLVEFSETTPGHYLRGFGGDTSNVAIAVARSGGKAAYATRIGNDEFGQMFVDLWDREGVDTSRVIRDESAPTGHYFVHQTDAGHRFSYARKGSAASLMRPGDLDASTIAQARVLHISGITCAISPSAAALAEQAAGLARQAGTRLSFDLNYRPALWSVDQARGVALSMLSQCDIALPSLEEAEMLFGLSDPEAIIDRVLSFGPQVVALTMGARGVFVATPQARRLIAPMSVDLVDASGAGDTFDGYFLSAMTAGDDLVEAAIRANAAAAFSTTRRGAVAGIPAGSEVEAGLRRA